MSHVIDERAFNNKFKKRILLTEGSTDVFSSRRFFRDAFLISNFNSREFVESRELLLHARVHLYRKDEDHERIKNANDRTYM